MSLQGSLRSLSIPDLLSLLHQHKKTGLLSLVSRQDERGILFHKGNLVYATACDGSRRLGHFLVRLGIITENDLNESAEARGLEPAFLGQELVSRGVLREKDLQSAVREQILDILDEALLWEDGAFHFDERSEGIPVPSGPVIPTQTILLDAIRRYDESQLIRASFPDLSVVLAMSPAPPAAGAAVPGQGAGAEDPAAEILKLVDGKRTVVQILRDSERSPFETAQVLNRLSREGRVRPAEGPSVSVRPAIPEPWSLPVSPDLPGRIYWVLRQNSKQSSQIARTIGREPALAAKALRQMIASRLDIPQGELSIPRLVEGLGDLRTHALILPEVIRGVFFAERDFFWKDCREHSVLCAHLCRDLAARVRYPHPEEAYLAGLIHKLGVFILIGVYPERYRKVLEEARYSHRDLRVLERREFGTSHDEIGGLYAERWRFPARLVETIRHHQMGGAGEANTLLDIISIGTWIASTNVVGVDFFSSGAGQIEEALRRIKLKKKNVLAMTEDSTRAAMAVQ